MPVDEGDQGSDEVPFDPSEDEGTYLPFDPVNVSTSSTGPEASSTTPPPSDLGPHPVTDEARPSDSEEERSASRSEEPEPKPTEPLPEFDPRFREEFEGLLFVGALTKKFWWLGHEFVIRTLTMEEVLEVGLVHKDYVGTMAEIKAYQAAVVAACVQSVDGRTMPMPITDEKEDTLLVNRFRYVLRHWFPPTIDAIYEHFLMLEAKVGEVLQAMGKAHG